MATNDFNIHNLRNIDIDSPKILSANQMENDLIKFKNYIK
jgi:hypothetical protein